MTADPPGPQDPDARAEVISARASELAALVENRLPETYRVTGDADAWPLVAAGLLEPRPRSTAS